jgi:hypothetical protein
MKTHDLKPLKAIEEFYQLNEEQLAGEKLSAHLTNVMMSFWYDLTSSIVADPDSYDIHKHGIEGPYRCLKMTPGADVIDTIYDRVNDKASDLTKALNKSFGKQAFEIRSRRDGKELDVLVAFISADGGIFKCSSRANEGSFGVAFRIPNDEEMKITFDSMAQVPAPSNVIDDEPTDTIDGIPENIPGVEEEIDILEPKGTPSSEYEDYEDANQEPFSPADDSNVGSDELTHLDENEDDFKRAALVGTIEGKLNVLKNRVKSVKDEDLREVIQAQIEELENTFNDLDLVKRRDPKKLFDDANVPGTSVGGAIQGGQSPSPDVIGDAGPMCKKCKGKECKCTGGPTEQTQYRYVSLQKLNPFQG